MDCKISNENAAKIFKMLRELPYKYSNDIIQLLEFSLQPLEEKDETREETLKGNPEKE